MSSVLNLPDDLRAFLADGMQLKYDTSQSEPGQVIIYSLDKLSLGTVYVTDSSNIRSTERTLSERGYYTIPAISLTSSCDDYDPAYILLWLPSEQVYGTWDCDHWLLYIFPGATWASIEHNPVPYINAQWDASSEVRQLFNPLGLYERTRAS
jgi:hypothetical protein